MVNLVDVEDNKKYYEKLNVGITFSNMWNTLETKSEKGTSKSEKGYQMIARSMAGKMAEALKLNPDLAQILTSCNGCFFPTYGQAGKKAIIQYLRDKNITITESELAKEFVEMQLSREGNPISRELDKMLSELFDDKATPTTPEVLVAKICGRTMDYVKRIENTSSINQVDLLYEISKDTVQSCEEERKPVFGKKLVELIKSVPELKLDWGELSEEQKENVYSRIDIFNNFYTDSSTLENACRFIAADSMER